MSSVNLKEETQLNNKIKFYQEKLLLEQKVKNEVFDYNTIRRTLIKGLPCKFIELPECPYTTEQSENGHRGLSFFIQNSQRLQDQQSRYS